MVFVRIALASPVATNPEIWIIHPLPTQSTPIFHCNTLPPLVILNGLGVADWYCIPRGKVSVIMPADGVGPLFLYSRV